VGVHVIGATLVWSTALWFHHGLSDHRPEEGPDAGPVPADGAGRTTSRAGATVPEPA